MARVAHGSWASGVGPRGRPTESGPGVGGPRGVDHGGWPTGGGSRGMSHGGSSGGGHGGGVRSGATTGSRLSELGELAPPPLRATAVPYRTVRDLASDGCSLTGCPCFRFPSSAGTSEDFCRSVSGFPRLRWNRPVGFSKGWDWTIRAIDAKRNNDRLLLSFPSSIIAE